MGTMLKSALIYKLKPYFPEKCYQLKKTSGLTTDNYFDFIFDDTILVFYITIFLLHN
jgi:hypothetical protein